MTFEREIIRRKPLGTTKAVAITIRVRPEVRDAIKAAAAKARKTVTDFIEERCLKEPKK